jgi:hypothetical protein
MQGKVSGYVESRGTALIFLRPQEANKRRTLAVVVGDVTLDIEMTLADIGRLTEELKQALR